MSTSGHGLLGPACSFPYIPWYRPCRSLFSSPSPSETFLYVYCWSQQGPCPQKRIQGGGRRREAPGSPRLRGFTVSPALLWPWISTPGALSGAGWETVPSRAQEELPSLTVLTQMPLLLWIWFVEAPWGKLNNCVLGCDFRTISFYIPARLSLVQLKEGGLAVQQIMRDSYQKWRHRWFFFFLPLRLPFYAIVLYCLGINKSGINLNL